MNGHDGAYQREGILLVSLWMQTLDRVTGVSATLLQSTGRHGEKDGGMDRGCDGNVNWPRVPVSIDGLWTGDVLVQV